MGTLPHHTGNVSVGYCGTISVVFVWPFLYAVCDASVPVHVANVLLLLLLLLLWHLRFSAIRLQLARCFCVFAVLFTIWPWIVLLNIQSKGACCICLVLSWLDLSFIFLCIIFHYGVLLTNVSWCVHTAVAFFTTCTFIFFCLSSVVQLAFLHSKFTWFLFSVLELCAHKLRTLQNKCYLLP